ncbi:putative transcriptional regulator, ArsR family [Aeropyrum pernix K1]|uniref:Transcriptional regulator, ArsR family n=1 Tax=Aeropyrum pernix (strain ATCC 700893 / DSM 11879 / JCM 9820 / NBRC 100138 / K1) TaxID=272557 RepID=Q9YFF1_AERPE|nr:winged helix-turn-helix domain-containing protein [Aeropyrum pernix]BAA79245.2 putative transcriptional regulator, ArsR family [Aeropyrum pernix K1]
MDEKGLRLSGGVRRLIPVRLEEAKALSDELRIMILEMLHERPMSVEEIVRSLRERGIMKTANTIRYHLSILKDSGLVDLTRVGRTYKYVAKSRYYAYTGDPEADKLIEEMAEEVKDDVKRIVEKLIATRGDELVAIAEKLKPCEFCVTKHFVEQVIFEIIKKSLGSVLAETTLAKNTDKEL